MSKLRLIPWTLSVLFAVWAFLVYFFIREHEWWPMFLYLPLLPFSIPLDAFARVVQGGMLPAEGATPAQYAANDHVYFLIYLVGGMLWSFVVGYVIKRAISALFPSLAKR